MERKGAAYRITTTRPGGAPYDQDLEHPNLVTGSRKNPDNSVTVGPARKVARRELPSVKDMG